MDRLSEFLVRHCRLAALLGLLSLLVPAYYLPQARIDNSIEVWLGRSSPQFHRYQEFLRRYGTEEFVLIASRMEEPLAKASLARQEELARSLERVEGVEQVLSLPELSKALAALAPSRAADLAHGPLARNLLLSSDGQTVGLVAWVKPSAGPRDRQRTVDGIERAAAAASGAGFAPHLVGTPLMNVHLDRASILVRPMDSSQFYTLLSAVREKTKPLPPAWTQCEITGAVLLLNEAQGSLVRTQVQSFGIAAVTVLLMIGLSFASWRAGLAAAVPNLLPVCGTFALMAMTNIPIDPATVMIASVAIGLAADDAIHYLACYRRWRRRNLSVPEAAYASLGQAGQAMAYSSVVAVAGFYVLCLAGFRPLAYFGLLTGSTLLVALVSDMVVMPAWCGLFRLWEKR